MPNPDDKSGSGGVPLLRLKDHPQYTVDATTRVRRLLDVINAHQRYISDRIGIITRSSIPGSNPVRGKMLNELRMVQMHLNGLLRELNNRKDKT